MNVKIKQNKNTPAVRVASAALAAFVLFFSLCVPSFAYTDNSLNGIDFSGQPIPQYEVLSPNTWEHAFNVSYNCGSTTYGADTTIVHARSTSDTIPIYVYAVQSGSSLSFIAIASDSVSVQWSFGSPNNSNYFGENAVLTQSPLNSSVYTYARSYSSSSSVLNVPVFSSSQDGIDAYLDWLENPPIPLPDPQGPLNISIPCGNALFIDITDLTGLTGTLTTQTNQSHSSPFSWNPTLSYTDSVPTSGTSIGNLINWNGTGGTDVFGRYRSWKCNLIVQPNKKYIAITNPFFNSEYLDPEHEDTNFPITVSLSNYRDYFFVPLNAQYVNGEGVQNNYTDEQTQNPIPGGNNSTTTGNSINDFLQNIASSISGFFQGAIGAVSTLVSSGSDFIRSLSGLYAWLPAPVYAVLTSALILVITIGVIKVFI